MERLTFYREIRKGFPQMPTCYELVGAIRRLAQIEDILGDDYDLDDLRRMKKERDAAVADLKELRFCDNCKYYHIGYDDQGPQECTMRSPCRDGDRWAWRGPKED